MLTNLELKNAYPGTHATSNAAFLSAATAKWTESTDYQLATTVDQIAAQHIGQETRLPSLELAMDLLTTVGQCDNGYACVYQNNLSWSSPTTPLPAEAHPRIAFERLFGDGGSAADRRAELRKNASLLDWVSEDIARLQKKLGPGDRTKVSQYLDTVREVERRIQKAESADRRFAPAGSRSSGRRAGRLRRPREADVRSAGAGAAGRRHPRDHVPTGARDQHAHLSRDRRARSAPSRSRTTTTIRRKLAKVAKINAFHVSLFAYFLEKLKATPDGNGSLLDHSIYLYGSGMGNPNVHDHVNLPILVAGGGAGKLKGGRHIKYAEPTPLANLHLTLLDKVGVHLDSFADSKGKVKELLEPLSL